MGKKPYIVNAYNTLTGKYEEVALSKEVYKVVTRTAWNIKDNNTAFFAHEIQFTSLLGGDNESFENFREFVSDESNPERIYTKAEEIRCLSELVGQAPQQEQQLITALFFDEKSTKQYAAEIGEPRTTVSSRKQKSLAQFRKNSIFKK